jgi:ribosome recycling factor
MQEEIQMALDEARDEMSGAIEHLKTGLGKIRAGKATPSMLDSVKVESYGTVVPLSQVANINTLDARTISIQPWDKSQLEFIERGIINSNIGLNPQNNGELVIINVPPLTEERRRDLVKKAKAEAENAKVSIRNNRKNANDFIKSLQKDGLAEDAAKGAEGKVQDLTNEYSAKVDALVEVKEKDIMTV